MNFREASINLAAITGNVRALRAVIGTPHLMAVVKANAYGHGAVESARAALAGGADWLGVADFTEAHALRSAGIRAPILAWLHDPEDDFESAVSENIDIGVSSLLQLRLAAQVATRLGTTARVQLKLDTGLSRNGVGKSQWPAVLSTARELQDAGAIRVTGLFSHLSNTSSDDDLEAIEAFRQGVELAASHGIEPDLLHIAATTAALRTPESRFTMVRLGIGIYGISPFEERSAADLGLTPAMTLQGRVAAVKCVPERAGVSYGYTYRAKTVSRLALVPLGYADGVPRQLSNVGTVNINGVNYSISGRVAMDQFVVDVGQDPVEVGDRVVLFGDPAAGVPGAEDWAQAAGTIGYEIVARIGARVPRTYG